MRCRIARNPRRSLRHYGYTGDMSRRNVITFFGYDARTISEVEISGARHAAT